MPVTVPPMTERITNKGIKPRIAGLSIKTKPAARSWPILKASAPSMLRPMGLKILSSQGRKDQPGATGEKIRLACPGPALLIRGSGVRGFAVRRIRSSVVRKIRVFRAGQALGKGARPYFVFRTAPNYREYLTADNSDGLNVWRE